MIPNSLCPNGDLPWTVVLIEYESMGPQPQKLLKRQVEILWRGTLKCLFAVRCV